MAFWEGETHFVGKGVTQSECSAAHAHVLEVSAGAVCTGVTLG